MYAVKAHVVFFLILNTNHFLKKEIKKKNNPNFLLSTDFQKLHPYSLKEQVECQSSHMAVTIIVKRTQGK